MSHLEQEIYEQPAVIRRLLSSETQNVSYIAQQIRQFNPAFVYIAARGTSDNAARYAQYVLGALVRMPVALAVPSLHTLYTTPPDLSRALVIGISQSGASTDVNRVISDANKQGALTVSLTNNPQSELATAAHHHIYLNAGEEKSVAATKTYTSELVAIAMLAAALANHDDLREEIEQLPAQMSETLNLSDNIPSWVQRYRYMTNFITIGRGYNYCTAFEISQKVQELCYIIGPGYSEADFRHGPMALIEPGFPVIVAAPQGETLPIVLDFLEKLAEKRAETLVISNNPSALARALFPMPIPNMSEWLSPVCAVIPGQVFALHLTKEKGYALDTPRNIQKVTITQ